MTRRDIRLIRGEIAVARKKERDFIVYKSQTDALLQVVAGETLTRTPMSLSLTGVDAQTQTDGQYGGLFSEDTVMEMGLGASDNVAGGQADLSPVYQTLESIYVEIGNSGINSVVLSNWLVSLLAIIRQMHPTCLSLSNYYYKNERRAQGTPLHMLKVDAGVCFMSALDNMCTYSTAGTGKGLFSDSEFFVHYAVANASCLSNYEISYIQFCKDPLSYTAHQLAEVVNAAILDIVDFVKKPLPPNEKFIVSAEYFPPSYVHVVEAVNYLLHTERCVAKHSVLVQFLPLASSSQKRADMANKEVALLGVVIRTALMWYMTYILSSTVQCDSIRAYHALLQRCMVRDGVVMQSLFSVGKGPFQSTGMLLPGLFAYLFFITREPGMTETLGSLSLSSPLGLQPTRSLNNRLMAWRTVDFGVRDKMVRFIIGDSVLKASVTASTAAFPGTTRILLQQQIDSSVVSFLRDLLMHEATYALTTKAVIDYLKEVRATTDYLQVSQHTRTEEYKLGKTNMTRSAMTGFLKNPFLYRMHNTMNFDDFGRETVHATRDTMVSTPVVSR